MTPRIGHQRSRRPDGYGYRGGVGARPYSERAMAARGLAVFVLVVALLAAAVACGATTEASYTTEDVIARFDEQAGAQLFRKQGPGGDPAWEQLGLAENAPPALIERFGIFSIYVVKPGEKEAMASLFRDKATKKPLAHRRGIYWELDSQSQTWVAHTRYANLVLVWFSEREEPAVDARWQRLHRVLRDLTTT